MTDCTVLLFSKLFLWHLDLAWKKQKTKNHCSSIVLLNLFKENMKTHLGWWTFTYQVDHAITSEKISTTSDGFKVKICSCYHFKDILIIYVLTVSSLKLRFSIKLFGGYNESLHYSLPYFHPLRHCHHSHSL